MPSLDNNIKAFLELVRAGLWEKEARLLPFEGVDFTEVYQLAQKQAVIGLVTAGLEHVEDIKIPQEIVLRSVGQVLQLEKRNQAMNDFIGSLVERMRNMGIYALLVKGQGIAQCYERPLWRTCGDVDFLLNHDNYKKAQDLLIPLATSVDQECDWHHGMTIDGWVVELHGGLHCGLSTKMDKVIDDVQRDVFNRGNVRSWLDGETPIVLPGIDNDVIFIFTHFLKHFYKEGLGLRQICDWCRLLCTYKESLNHGLLESRIREMGLMTEWKAFAAFAVTYLGMPAEAMPLYSKEEKWKRKARRILQFILMSGNFGHNRDYSYKKYPFLIRKFFSMKRRVSDLARHALIFPMDSLRFFPKIILDGLRAAAKGIG